MDKEFDNSKQKSMKKWRFAFFICLFLLIGVTSFSGYIILTNTILSGNNMDILVDLNNDIEITSTLLTGNLKHYDEIITELETKQIGHSPSSDKTNIRLTHLKLLFDNKGQWVGMTTASVQE